MKILPSLLGVILVASNAWWIYRAIDQGITNSYAQQETYKVANRAVALSAITTEAVKDKSKLEAVALLKKLFPGQEPFEKDGAVHIYWISLPLSSEGRVLGVELDEGTKSLAKVAPAGRK